MAVIIEKENGKAIYNKLNISKEEKMRAQKLDNYLSKVIPEIEKEWVEKRMSRKGGRKIDINLVYRIGKKLSNIVDNENLVASNERKWVWKAIREIYLESSTFSKRSETRDDLEYFYKVSKYPLSFLKNISWDGWRRLLDSPSIQEDRRFEEWLQKKAEGIGILKRGFIRRFAKNLYSLIKNKDTTVLTNQELFKIYELAWKMSR